MTTILPRSFYDRPTKKVAMELLGKILCRKIGHKIIKGKIVEVEAYLGAEDLACHTSKGKTKRNEVMFGPAGHAYVYFIYGMYHCFNVVTERQDSPCAILVRALESIDPPSEKAKSKRMSGPAKICRELEISKELNGWDLTLGKELWIEESETIKPSLIVKSKRIGVDYAGIWKDKLLRFHIRNNDFVSKK